MASEYIGCKYSQILVHLSQSTTISAPQYLGRTISLLCSRMSSICLYLVFFLAVLGVDGSLFTGDKYVQEIGTHSQLQALLQHLASPNCGVDSSVGSGAEDFKISSDDMVYSIIFYADWCPHCHKQAPIWSNLAIQFHCTPGIRWFAFECSKGGKERIGPDGIAPFDACQNQSIAGFPTMYAYWPKRWDNPTNTDVVVDPTDFSIVEKVVNTVTGAFSPVEKVDQLFYNITTESGVQDEVILRSRMNNVLRSLFQYQEWILSRSPIHKLTRCTLTSDSDFFGPDIPRVEMDRIITTEQRWPSEVLTPCPDLRLHDGLSGFLYLLRNWVITDTNGLTAERNSDLRELTGRFLSLFPGFNTQLSLRDFHTALSRQSTFTSSEYQSMVDKLELAGLKAHPIGQRPDLLYTPRITSAIWLLFHTLTVSLFVQVHSTEASRVLSQFNNSCSNNQHVVLPVHPDMKTRLETLENLRQTYPQTPWSVAKAIRKTVGNFFGCDVCRLHFTSLFDVCYAGLCKWVKDKTNTVTIASETTVNTTVNTRNSFTIEDTNEGLLLWLWRFHNAVTFRTAVERTSDSIVTLQELSSHEEKLKPGRDPVEVEYLFLDFQSGVLSATRAKMFVFLLRSYVLHVIFHSPIVHQWSHSRCQNRWWIMPSR